MTRQYTSVDQLFSGCGDCPGYEQREAIHISIAGWETVGYRGSLALIFGQLALALSICPGISSNSAAAPLS